MVMREKLIELLSGFSIDTAEAVEFVADYLIANGVIVLPCSYGKTVYAIGNKKIVECEIDEISFGVVGLMYLVSFDCDSDCEGCPFDSWRQDYSDEWSCDGEYNQAVVKGHDFGKTVFLTREEAEAALAKMDGDENA